jgi:hypothetical protein
MKKLFTSNINIFSLFLFVFVISFFNPHTASANSCFKKPTVLDEYEWAKEVIIARAVLLKSSEEENKNEVIHAKLIVEKIFKGNLNIGDEIGVGCYLSSWPFTEEDNNKQFLFYLTSIGDSKTWLASECGRSNPIEYADDDLLYLNNIDKVRGKTRISGALEFDKNADQSVEGIKIHIIGPNRSYEVTTDKHGVYEIYDLPAGAYLVEPDAPFGWKINEFWLYYSPSRTTKIEKHRPNQVPIFLPEKKHASLDFHFEIDNAICGKVFDTNGRPMRDVDVSAIPIDSNDSDSGRDGRTDENGQFTITRLSKGSYILEINGEGKITGSQPFHTFCYPDVHEREKATVLAIDAGDFIEDINIYAPQAAETVTIEGTCLYSDGKPVMDGAVEFKTENVAEDDKINIDGNARAEVDSQGRFSIKILVLWELK